MPDAVVQRPKFRSPVVQWEESQGGECVMATTIKKKGAPEFDWRTIKIDWLAKNLRVGQKPFTLKQVATKWGVAYGTVKNKAYRDGWRNQLTQAKAERDKRSSVIVARYVTEVRWLQARLARVAIVKAMKALKQKDLTVSEAIRLVKLGLEQERRALGIPKLRPPEHHPPTDDEYESVEDKMLRVRKFRDLADRFLKFVSDWDKGHHAKAASG